MLIKKLGRELCSKISILLSLYDLFLLKPDLLLMHAADLETQKDSIFYQSNFSQDDERSAKVMIGTFRSVLYLAFNYGANSGRK